MDTMTFPLLFHFSFRSNGMPDYEKLVDQIVATNADGFNGDTLDGVNQTW